MYSCTYAAYGTGVSAEIKGIDDISTLEWIDQTNSTSISIPLDLMAANTLKAL